MGTTEGPVYVRWKTRETSPPHWGWRARIDGRPVPERPTLLMAALVESHRVDGKPRQRMLAYLGSIRSDRLESGERHPRAHFWRGARWNLDRLGLPDAQRAAVEAKLSERVPEPPPPTAEEVAENAERLKALEHEIALFRLRRGLR